MHAHMDTAVRRPPPPAAPDRDDGRALYVRGMAALRDWRHDAASSLFIRALRRQPTHLGMRRNLVRALLGARQLAQLVPQADVALAADPDDAELHFARGTALRALGKVAAACAAFNRAVTLQPGQARFWLAYGDVSADLANLDAAENLYRTAAALAPDLPEAHASLARRWMRERTDSPWYG
jgi:tetratricopeptide (TPR) repeat protein